MKQTPKVGETWESVYTYAGGVDTLTYRYVVTRALGETWYSEVTVFHSYDKNTTHRKVADAPFVLPKKGERWRTEYPDGDVVEYTVAHVSSDGWAHEWSWEGGYLTPNAGTHTKIGDAE